MNHIGRRVGRRLVRGGWYTVDAFGAFMMDSKTSLRPPRFAAAAQINKQYFCRFRCLEDSETARESEENGPEANVPAAS